MHIKIISRGVCPSVLAMLDDGAADDDGQCRLGRGLYHGVSNVYSHRRWIISLDLEDVALFPSQLGPLRLSWQTVKHGQNYVLMQPYKLGFSVSDDSRTRLCRWPPCRRLRVYRSAAYIETLAMGVVFCSSQEHTH